MGGILILALRSPDEVLGSVVTGAGFGRVDGADTSEGLCAVSLTVGVIILLSLIIGFFWLLSLDWSLVTTGEEVLQTETAGALETVGLVFSSGLGTVTFTGAVLGFLGVGWLPTGTGEVNSFQR